MPCWRSRWVRRISRSGAACRPAATRHMRATAATATRPARPTSAAPRGPIRWRSARRVDSGSQALADRRPRRADRSFVALVEGPLPDLGGSQQAGVGHHLQVDAGGGLADAELLRQKETTDTIAHQIAIDLRREVRTRILQPLEDLQPLLVGQCTKEIDAHRGLLDD